MKGRTRFIRDYAHLFQTGRIEKWQRVTFHSRKKDKIDKYSH